MTSSYAGQLSLQQSMSPGDRNAASSRKLPSSAVYKNDLAKLKNSGIDVMKISQNGKKLRRKLKLSSDNDTLLISSNKKEEFQRLDINRIWSVSPGQVSEKFVGAKVPKKSSSKKKMNKEKTDDDSLADSIYDVHYLDNDEKLSLTILYVAAGENNQRTTSTLDLVLTSKPDYDAVHRSLAELTRQSHTTGKEKVLNLDLLLMRGIFTELGKDVDGQLPDVEQPKSSQSVSNDSASSKGAKAGPHNNKMTFPEFKGIVESKLGVTVLTRTGLWRIYRDFARANGIKPEKGMTSAQCAQLLQPLREQLHQTKVESVGKGKVPKVIERSAFHEPWATVKYENEPLDEVLTRMEVGGHNTKGKEYVSAPEFLNFVQTVQNDKKATLAQVRELFNKINEQRSLESMRGQGSVGQSSSDVSQQARISREDFMAYLTSDANDIFDPVKGWVGRADMTQPLSNYWINTCNDAFHTGENGGTEGVMMALNRGFRCLELKVWNGEGKSKGEPVVAARSKDASIAKGNAQFLNVLKTIKSFLRSNPDVFPIILSLENHCALPIQHKMARYIHEVLGSNLYKPKAFTGRLPSPESLKGKVVMKSKHRLDTQEEAVALFDDYDADLEQHLQEEVQPVCSFDADHQLEPIDSMFSEQSEKTLSRSPDDMWKEAQKEAYAAKEAARKTEEKAFKLEVQAHQSEELASKLLTKFGWPFDVVVDDAGGKSSDQVNSTSANGNQSTSNVAAAGNNRSTTNTSPKAKSSAASAAPSLKGALSDDMSKGASTLDDMSMQDGSTIATYDDDHTKKDDASILSNASGSTFFTDGGASYEFPSLTKAASDLVSNFMPNLGWQKPQADTRQTEQRASGNARKQAAPQIESPPARVISNQSNAIETEAAPEVNGAELKSSQKNNLATSVDNMRKKVSDAEDKAHQASEAASIALAALQQASADVTTAQEGFESAKLAERDAMDASESAASQARTMRGHADTAAKRITTVRELLERSKEQAKSADTVSNTALSECKISDQRYSEAAARAAKAQKNAKDAVARAEAETKEEERMERELAALQRKLTGAGKVLESAQKRKAEATFSLVKITEAIEICADDETITLPQSVKDSNNKAIAKLNQTTEEHSNAEKLTQTTQKSLIDLQQKLKKQSEKAAAARNHADQFSAIAEQLAEHAEEEKDATNLRRVATEKAEVNAKRIEAEIKSIEAQLVEAERASEESNQLANESRQRADKLAAASVEAKKARQKKTSALRKQMAEKEDAQQSFDTAQKVKERREGKLRELRKIVEDAMIVYDRAQSKVTQKKHRKEQLNHAQRNAIASRDRAVSMRKKANEAKLESNRAISIAADKTALERHAFEYKNRTDRIRPVSLKLTQMTLLNGVKFKYLEKSKTLPYSDMHSISEQQLFKLAAKGLPAWKNWQEFNADHITRIFPMTQEMKESGNFNPMVPWAMGCQLIAMTSQSPSEELWLNDGRFRENGSSGYVLQPLLMRHSKEFLSSGAIRVLGAERVPHPEGQPGKPNKHPNCHVKVSVFDVIPGGHNVAAHHHTTKSVDGNCLSPVWNESEEDCAKFEVASPSVAMVLFTVWGTTKDKKAKGADGGDIFIASAAIPYNCLREGYRSVQLFDRNHTRCAEYAFASLLVKVNIDSL